MDTSRLEILAKLPVLLNSSLTLERVIAVAIEHLKSELGAEAATVFLLNENSTELLFWAASGGSEELLNQKMPANKGIVGAVIDSQSPEIVNDPSKDKRFFSDIDKKGAFETRNILCVPLSKGGQRKVGAIQVLNKQSSGFNDDDLEFVNQTGLQLSIAIENAKLHEELMERTKRLEMLNTRRSEMLSVISHEFRTPFSLIQSSVSMLSSLNPSDGDAQDKIIEILNNGISRLTNLIKQVGQLSSLTEMKYIAKITKFEIKDLFDSAVAQIEDGLEKRDITFTSNIEPKDIKVKGDVGLLSIALGQLLSNALRFTPEKGEVALSATVNNALCRITVKDTGIGIKKEDHKTVFESFYHVGDAGYHSSGKFEFMSGGLGIGLSTVKTILEAHNICIELKSEPEKGAEFSFNIPVVD